LLWDRAVNAVRHLSVLLLEVRQCHWSDRAISERLLCLPARHDSTFLMVARKTGRTLRKQPQKYLNLAWSAANSVRNQLYL
jgi:hypothetical protein